MGHGYKHGTSGKKENPLNFEVKTYPSEVELNTATAADKTLGVVTTNPVTGWYIDSKQPENMAEGELWFYNDDSADVAFNALNTNNIKVYPKSVKQWVSGELVDLKAKFYQNNSWHELESSTTVFDRENQSFSDINSNIHVVNDPTYSLITDGTTYVEFTANGSLEARAWQWKNPIDFSKYSKMEVVGCSTNGTFGIAPSLASGTNFTDVYKTASLKFTVEESTHELDISSINTTEYIGFYANQNHSIKIKRILLY